MSSGPNNTSAVRGRPAAAAGVPASTRTVDRALDLLDAVAGRYEGATLSELARATKLSPATASRLLATLEQRGLIARDSHGLYRPGSGLMRIAATVLRADPLYELAGPHLTQLAQQTGETANLGIAVDAETALYLRQVSGEQRVQTSVRNGQTIPRAGTSMGAALDGQVPARGYVAIRGAVEADITAMAAPVRDLSGRIVAALSVIAPSYRTSEQDIASYGPLLVEHAAELSLALP